MRCSRASRSPARTGTKRRSKRRLALEGHEGRKLPYLVLAQVERAHGDLPGSLATLDGVLARLAASGQGEMTNVHALRGDVLARLDRPREAEAEFRKEIAIFPENLSAWAGLALLCASEGRREDVRAAILGMLHASPNAERPARRRGDAAGARRSGWSSGARAARRYRADRRAARSVLGSHPPGSNGPQRG